MYRANPLAHYRATLLDWHWLRPQEREQPLRIRKSPVHAWGLYATHSIPPEAFVIEYVGERVRAPLADVREKVHAYSELY